MSKQEFHFLVVVTASDSVAANAIISERISHEESYDFPGGDDYQITYDPGAPVFVVQSEMGDVVDVTTSEEWAEHLVGDDDDTPIRTVHEDTLWTGPDKREDW